MVCNTNHTPQYIFDSPRLYAYDIKRDEYVLVFTAPLSPFLLSKTRAIELYEKSLAVQEETQCTQD